MPDALTLVGLVALGIAVATYGTMIGAGGGFVLTPLLIILYPNLGPEVITALSLGVVSVNAVSGSIAYGHQKRIDYVAGSLFAASTLPGAFGGALIVQLIPRDAFELAFGALLMSVAVWLLLPRPNRIVTALPPRRFVRRLLTDAHGDTYRYAFDPYLGVLMGIVIGFISSLFGVGGGIILVPAMILLMRFPAHIATATSTFALMFTAGAGAAVHIAAGHYSGVLGEEGALAVGVLVGAQVGALVSLRLTGRVAVVTRLLSVALVLVALRLVTGVLL